MNENLQTWSEAHDKSELVKALRDYKDTGLTPRQIRSALDTLKLCDNIGVMRMNEILDAEQEGRLVVLPCKVGDTVYQKDHCGEIYEAVVQSIVIDKMRTIFITSGIGFDETAVGKTAFLSLEEAEKEVEP